MSASSSDRAAAAKILKDALTEVLERRPANPIEYIRDSLRNSIRFQGAIPIIQAFNRISSSHWTSEEFQLQLPGAFDMMKSLRKDSGQDPSLDLLIFKDFLKLFLREKSGIKNELIDLVASWAEYEPTVSFEVFSMACLVFSLMDDYFQKVAILFKIKAEGGVLPLNLLQDTFKSVARIDVDVLNDPKDGLRSYLSNKLFEHPTSNNEQQQKFISPKELEVMIEKRIALLS
ncbi:hypothetical protein BDR26DRAFT_858949 [Obelidium mucronatum]|nr:hypothetical protein BDR26DRAFT_858949 [Obelidium mucronatum]